MDRDPWLNKTCEDFAAKRRGVDPTKGLPALDTPIGRMAVRLREWPLYIEALGYVKVDGRRLYAEVAVERKAGRWTVERVMTGKDYADVASLYLIQGASKRLRQRIADAVVPAVARWASEHPCDLERQQRESYLSHLQTFARKPDDSDPYFDDLGPDVCRAIIEDYRPLMSGELKAAYEAAARAADKYTRELRRIYALSRRELRSRERKAA